MRNFTTVKRVVIKLGTNVLSTAGHVDANFLGVIARQVAQLMRQKRQVLLVTSGAIGMGRMAMGISSGIMDVKKRQACAAVGQSILMQQYQQAFNRYKLKIAQVLLTNAIFNNRRYYVNIKNTVETLLNMSVVPIINENDCVSIDEIGLAFGDNDKLSALVASKIDAELLIMLTDVDGFYSGNPRDDKSAQKIPVVYEINPEIEAMAGNAGSQLGTGGMASKLSAIRIAAQAGCRVVLAHGRQENVISRIMAGETLGTLFLPRRRLSNRKRWVLNHKAEGTIYIDSGAATALNQHRSLLLVGITAVTGRFNAGDIVEIAVKEAKDVKKACEAGIDSADTTDNSDTTIIAKGITRVSSNDVQEMLKEIKHQLQPQKSQPKTRRKAIVHANDTVLLGNYI